MNKLKKYRGSLSVGFYGDCSQLHLFFQILCCAKLAGASSVSIIPGDQSFSVTCKRGKVIRDIAVNISWHAVRPIISRCKLLSGMKLYVRDVSQRGEFQPPRSYGLPVCRAVTNPTEDGESLKVIFVR
jgi:type II secretory ATPase GspE/PulE/Tfp pilus assembly ATPase PilB-like protein